MTDNTPKTSKLSKADREMRDLARAIAPFTGGVPPNENLILKGLMQLPRMLVQDVEQTVPSPEQAGTSILDMMQSANEGMEDYGGRLALALEREDIALRTGQPPDQGLVEMATDIGLALSPLSAGRSGLGMLPKSNPNAWRSGAPPPLAGGGVKGNPPSLPRSPMPMQDANALNRPPAVPPAQQIARGPRSVLDEISGEAGHAGIARPQSSPLPPHKLASEAAPAPRGPSHVLSGQQQPQLPATSVSSGKSPIPQGGRYTKDHRKVARGEIEELHRTRGSPIPKKIPQDMLEQQITAIESGLRAQFKQQGLPDVGVNLRDRVKRTVNALRKLTDENGRVPKSKLHLAFGGNKLSLTAAPTALAAMGMSGGEAEANERGPEPYSILDMMGD